MYTGNHVYLISAGDELILQYIIVTKDISIVHCAYPRGHLKNL